MATSSGHTFHITGTTVSGKVVTTKLPLPANSKIVTVNVPATQGGKGIMRHTSEVVLRVKFTLS